MAISRITTVLTPATSYDLTDLPTVKDELKIPATDTSNDTWLTRAITQTSNVIRQYCNQPFAIEAIKDLLDIEQDPYPYQTPGGVDPLRLTRWPLVNYALLFTSADVASGTVLPFLATTGATVGQPVSGPNIAPDTTIAALAATSITLSAPVTQLVSARSPIACGFALSQVIATDQIQALVVAQDLRVDPADGLLIRLNPFTGTSTTWEALPVIVTYSAGYAAVPDEIVMACLRLITSRFYSRGRDPLLRQIEQPNLGSQTYWVGGPPNSGMLPLDVSGLLDAYRVPVAI